MDIQGMTIYKLTEILKRYTDRNRYESGKAFFKNKAVFNDYAKLEDSTVIFYGTVIDEYRRQNYSAMVTINLKPYPMIESSCDCQSILTSNHTMNMDQLCSHRIAVALNGIEKLSRPEEEEKEAAVIIPQLMVNMGPSRNGFMKMDLEIEGIEKKEYRKIFNSYKDGKKTHRLPNGDYLDLTDEQFVAAFKMIDVLGVYNEIENIKIPYNKAMYLEKLVEEDLDFIGEQKYITKILDKYKKNLSYKVPENLKATLRSYQVEGFEFLSSLAHYEMGGLLADEMGLGKTLQVITFLLSQQGKQSLVITPTALVYNWKSEFEKFAPDLKVAVVHGNGEKRKALLEDRVDYDVLLTTYTTYKNDLEAYKNISFDYCIIDEAQQIKNAEAQITKAIKEINAKVKFALTGTPIENHLLELWSIFDFIMPGYLYNKLRFQNVFVNDEKNLDELKRMISPFMIRRTKKEVIKELPDKIEQKLIVGLEGYHQSSYAGFVKLIKRKIQENDHNNMTLFSYLTKLRQLCLAPEVMVKDYKGRNTKLELLMQLINGAGDKKILVFSQFTKVLELIGERLTKEGMSYSYIDGKTSAEERVKRVQAFNESEDNKVFLISLKAGGTGLNLTSASLVIHFDPWWNPAAEDQASDRAHRIGQENVVNVIKLIAKGTVEERVLALQEVKKGLIEDVLEESGNSSSINRLSKEELMGLFEI